MASLSPKKIVGLLINRAESPKQRSRQTAEEIAQSEISMLMWKLDNFTVDLEAKVDGLLQNQEQ